MHTLCPSSCPCRPDSVRLHRSCKFIASVGSSIVGSGRSLYTHPFSCLQWLACVLDLALLEALFNPIIAAGGGERERTHRTRAGYGTGDLRLNHHIHSCVKHVHIPYYVTTASLCASSTITLSCSSSHPPSQPIACPSVSKF